MKVGPQLFLVIEKDEKHNYIMTTVSQIFYDKRWASESYKDMNKIPFSYLPESANKTETL